MDVAAGFGFSIDLCRALSAAIFDGDDSRTEFSEMEWFRHWNAIANGTIDVSTSMATHTMERDVMEPH